MDQVVDEYAPVIVGLEIDIDEIEDQLFKSDPSVSRRIYDLSREVIEFQRATHPLLGILSALEDGFHKNEVDIELQRRLRDVKDHAIRIIERADSFRSLLQSALSVNSTLVSQQQNEEVKKISAWAAILFAPTLVGTIYGMNLRHMPELNWNYGYPMAIGLMIVTSMTLYFVFKRRNWL